MPKKGKNTYSQDDLKSALDAVTNGMSKKGAAKKFGVPKSTIQFRLSKNFTKSSLGPAPVLLEEDETLLVKWLIDCQRKGQPRRAEDLKVSVKKILDITKRPNPFVNNKPGQGWYNAFLRRHPELSIRVPEEVTRASSCVSKENIERWFKDVKDSLEDEHMLSILEDPNRIFNCDETGFALNPANGKVIAAKGDRFVYEVDKGPAKSNITVLYCFSASGVVVPPLIVYPYTRIPAEISKSVVDAGGDEDWGIGNSENGWMTSEVFYEYIGKIFHNFVLKKNIQKPVILFVDGHKTHLTYQLSKLCGELGIVLIVLYPNATRILQPCDVSIFRPLKAAWQRETLSWYRDHPGEVITKVVFASVLKQVMYQISEATAANAFKACGLYPFDSSSINYSKCLGSTTTPTSEDSIVRPAIQEKCLSRTEFLQILSPHMEILAKDAENAAEKIVQEIYNKLSEQQPSHHSDLLPEISDEQIDEVLGETLNTENLITNRVSSSQVVPSPAQLSPETLNTENVILNEPSSSRAPSPSQVTTKDILMWPTTPKRKGNRKPVKRRDYVVSSSKWKRQIEEEQEMKKKKKEELDDKRKKREELKKQKSEKKEMEKQKRDLKKTKKIKLQDVFSSDSSSESELFSHASSLSESDEELVDATKQVWVPIQKKVDEFVAFQYNEKLYPGKIISTDEDTATISSMVQIGRLWKWPEREDVMMYPWSTILGHIDDPKKTSKTRNVYEVKELNRFLD